jgi:hypothetical protein
VISAIAAVAGAILAWQRCCRSRNKKAEDGKITAPDLPAMYQIPEEPTLGLMPGHQEGTYSPTPLSLPRADRANFLPSI